MTLRSKLTLCFLFLCITPIFLVGIFAYSNGKKTIEQETFNHLSATNSHKKILFENWLKNKMETLEFMTACPFFTRSFPRNACQYQD